MNNNAEFPSYFGGIMDFYHSNEYLVELSNWFGSEIYEDIVDYLEHNHVEWRKNKGLGSNAPEFFLEVINEVGIYSAEEDTVDEDGQYSLNLYGYHDWLIKLYETIVDSYGFYCGRYQLSQEAEEDLSGIDVDYSSAYDMVYQDEGEIISYWF
jgi:hypothetical protein